jgi:hypothetical protein
MDLQWWIQLILLGVPAWIAARYYHKQVQLMKQTEAQKEIFPKVSKWRQQLPFILMAILLLANWIPRFIKPSVTIGNCKTVLTGWGASGNHFFVAVDSDMIGEYQKTNRLMFITRPADHTVDGKRDRGIAKSGSFGIVGGPMQIDTVASDEFMKRTASTSGWVEFHVVMIPRDTDTDKVASLEDVEKFGGKDIETRMFMLPVTTFLVPQGQKPPPTAY